MPSCCCLQFTIPPEFLECNFFVYIFNQWIKSQKSPSFSDPFVLPGTNRQALAQPKLCSIRCFSISHHLSIQKVRFSSEFTACSLFRNQNGWCRKMSDQMNLFLAQVTSQSNAKDKRETRMFWFHAWKKKMDAFSIEFQICSDWGRQRQLSRNLLYLDQPHFAAEMEADGNARIIVQSDWDQAFR